MADDNKQINCEVLISPTHRHGVYANAFRVLPDGGEFLLDFLVYSPLEKSAKVVSRLRVTPPVLTAIKERLSTPQVNNPNPLFVAKGSGEVH